MCSCEKIDFSIKNFECDFCEEKDSPLYGWSNDVNYVNKCLHFGYMCSECKSELKSLFVFIKKL